MNVDFITGVGIATNDDFDMCLRLAMDLARDGFNKSFAERSGKYRRVLPETLNISHSVQVCPGTYVVSVIMCICVER